MMRGKVSGIETISRNLTKAIDQLKMRSTPALIEIAIGIRRSMDNNAPSIPVDQGNLRNSWFIIAVEGGAEPAGKAPRFIGDQAGKMSADHSTVKSKVRNQYRAFDSKIVVMGFSAFYAVYVHEMVGANFKQPKAGAVKAPTGAKFFEAALARYYSRFLPELARRMKI